MFEHQHNEINKWQQLKSLFPIQSRQRQKLEYPKPDKLKSGGSATLHCSPICKKKTEAKGVKLKTKICHSEARLNISYRAIRFLKLI